MNADIVLGGSTIVSIVGLVEVAKTAGLPTRYAPIAAILFGVLASIAGIYANQYPWIPAVAVGISLGLAACGAYSGAKTVVKKPAADSASAAPATPPTA